MNNTEHSCPKDTRGGVPNNRFKIESWDVCFGGRVSGLIDYMGGKGTSHTAPNMLTHVRFCPFCGQDAMTEMATVA